MLTHRKPLFELTAGDLMCRNLITVPEGMLLRDAAKLLIRSSVHGVPVVGSSGQCVGVLSLTDLARWAVKPAAPPSMSACIHQERLPGLGRRKVLCRLPFGSCALQRRLPGSEGSTEIVCVEPEGVPTDWQVIDPEALPPDDVRHHMTADPVTVWEGADIRTVARLMTDATIHRVIVADRQNRPIGLVSCTDLVAALLYAPQANETNLAATARSA